MLAIARGLISRPKLLMLDEMSLGLMPTHGRKNDGDYTSHNQIRHYGSSCGTNGSMVEVGYTQWIRLEQYDREI